MNTDQVHEPITEELTMRLQAREPHFSIRSVPVATSLFYVPDSPYSIRVTFHRCTGDDPVVWEIGRDLIRDGLIRLTGEGDVQIGPGADRGIVTFRFRVNGKVAIFTAPSGLLRAYLQRTAKVVPYGHETSVPNVAAELDAALTRILAQAE